MSETKPKTEKKQRKRSPPRHSKAIDNLIPFQPNQSGNRNGRPLGVKNRSTLLKQWLNTEIEVEDLEGNKKRLTAEDGVVLALIKAAQGQNVHAIKEILDSAYGKLTEKIETTDIAKQADDDAQTLENVVKVVLTVVESIASGAVKVEEFTREEVRQAVLSEFLTRDDRTDEGKELVGKKLLGEGK